MRTYIVVAAFVVMAIACLTSSRAQSVTLLASQHREIPFHLASGYLIVVKGHREF